MSGIKRIAQRVDQVSTGDISAVTTTAPLQGGGTSGALALTLSPFSATTVTAVAADYVIISDTNDSNAVKKALISDITALAGTVTSVTGTAPIVSTGGATPAISITVDAGTLVLAGQVFG
jgi:predicted RNA methylase